MTAIQGARERARSEITQAIKDEARRQLAAEGAAKLSLRAISRELGMVSSALYRYFPSRDDLLTELIIDAYNAVGAEAENALAAAGRSAEGPAGPTTRWVAVCCAVRTWALAHPHEYALIYGSPVPGYSAPEATIVPASRSALALLSVVRDTHRSGRLALTPLAPAARPEAERMAASLADDLPPEAVASFVAAWAQLSGLVSFELFGQFHKVVEDRDAFFAQAARRLAFEVGLRTAA